MSTLREALATIKAELDKRSEEGEAHLFLNVPYWQLEELLAAHPAEPAPAASRDRVAEVLRAELLRQRADEWFDVFGLARYLLDSLLAAGVLRDEAEVKAEALDQAAEQIVIPGASSLAAAWLQGRATRLRGESNG